MPRAKLKKEINRLKDKLAGSFWTWCLLLSDILYDLRPTVSKGYEPYRGTKSNHFKIPCQNEGS